MFFASQHVINAIRNKLSESTTRIRCQGSRLTLQSTFLWTEYHNDQDFSDDLKSKVLKFAEDIQLFRKKKCKLDGDKKPPQENLKNETNGETSSR